MKADNIAHRTAFIIHKIAYNQKTKIAFVKWKLYGNLMSLKYINSRKDAKNAKKDFRIIHANETHSINKTCKRTVY